MPFVDYSVTNYCKTCDLRYPKEKGTFCIQCGARSRTAPRKTSKNREDYRRH